MTDKSSKPASNELTTIVKLLTEIERKQAVLQADVHDIKHKATLNQLNVSTMQSHIKEQNGRMRMVEEDIGKMREEMRGVAVSQEVIEDKVDQMLEALSPELEKITDNSLKLEEHDTQIIQHTIRLSALENAA